MTMTPAWNEYDNQYKIVYVMSHRYVESDAQLIP